jgi:demethylmenaquinone methyltransferase / 2-methoxy-6-polyprenyl-1,4-benzoquinol methylase
MMAQETKAAHVHRVFSHIARRYDFMNSVLSFQQHKLWRYLTMKKLNIKAGSKVLDVAAGTGAWTFSLAKTVGSSGKVIGLDFCQEMLDVAIERRPKLGYSETDLPLLHGDAMALPFADNSFDFTTIGFALRNVPDVIQCLKEMTRVVRPGGKVVSLELSKPESKAFRALYFFYFYKILPILGAIVVGKKEPYSWLPESLTDFPNRKRLAVMFEEAGLIHVESYAFTGGIAALHIGQKPEIRS